MHCPAVKDCRGVVGIFVGIVTVTLYNLIANRTVCIDCEIKSALLETEVETE